MKAYVIAAMSCDVAPKISFKTNNVPLNEFYILMASENSNIIRNIAMYIYYALKEREAYLHVYL